ncbi:hypothetical protein CPB86DRAFT_784740 [Serendipita vermifera]|nr:hypothetical protein CPB86DRAFT_784740 [Serendipita vermifera]
MSSVNIYTIRNEIMKCDLQILRLEDSLRVVQQNRRRWETKLAFAMTKGLDYFNKCPTEIFIEIFKLYLIPRHRSIRTLLFVCKKWNQLVMNTPTLWNRIDLCFDSGSISDGPLSLVPYIQACKERSQNLRLDINLNLRDIGDAFGHHMRIVNDSIQGQCRNCLLASFEGSDSIWECPSFERRIEELTDTVGVLMGTNSNDMARWSSFRLALPQQEDILPLNPTFRLFNGPTDSLLSISIEGLEEWMDVADFDDEFDLFPVTGDLSRIERLTLSHDGNIGAFPFQWSSIKQLDIVIRNNQNLVTISTLRSLETLAITAEVRDTADLGETNVRYHFPRLRSMDIKGLLANNWFDIVNLEAPSLQCFSLGLLRNECSSLEPFNMSFPKISPRTFIFNILQYLQLRRSSLFMPSWPEPKLRTAAAQVLRHFSSAEEIIFGGIRDEIIVEALTDRVQGGRQCPISVYSESKGEFYRLYHAKAILEVS